MEPDRPGEAKSLTGEAAKNYEQKPPARLRGEMKKIRPDGPMIRGKSGHEAPTKKTQIVDDGASRLRSSGSVSTEAFSARVGENKNRKPSVSQSREGSAVAISGRSTKNDLQEQAHELLSEFEFFEEKSKIEKELFHNKMPEELSKELLCAKGLGITATMVGNSDFDKVVNQGDLKWAVLSNGDLVVVSKKAFGEEIAHTVLSRGGPVLAAGEADIAGSAEAGYFGLSISNHSGHYMPSAASLKIGFDAFALRGIRFDEEG